MAWRQTGDKPLSETMLILFDNAHMHGLNELRVKNPVIKFENLNQMVISHNILLWLQYDYRSFIRVFRFRLMDWTVSKETMVSYPVYSRFVIRLW